MPFFAILVLVLDRLELDELALTALEGRGGEDPGLLLGGHRAEVGGGKGDGRGFTKEAKGSREVGKEVMVHEEIKGAREGQPAAAGPRRWVTSWASSEGWRESGCHASTRIRVCFNSRLTC